MADIRPLRAVRYSPTAVGDLTQVVTPPYDVIDDAMLSALYDQHPNNFVRLDFGKVLDSDDESNNRYTRSAETLQQWRDEGVLVRDEVPGVYVYEQTFDADGTQVTRTGFLAGIRLHDYADRVVLPHERTLTGPKADRMSLMVATQAQLSQLFLLYNDPESVVDRALALCCQGEPDIDITTPGDEIRHRLWTVTNPSTIAAVQAEMADRQLLIADGHHRYETALAFRDAKREEEAGDGEQPYDFALAYLANSADPGLIVWPTHRAVHSVPGFDFDTWLDAVAPYFEVEALNPEFSPKQCEALLNRAGEKTPSFVALRNTPEGTRAWLLRLDAEAAKPHLDEIPGPDAARTLDVNVLHDFVLPKLTGIDLAAQYAKTNIHYIKGLENAFDAVAEHQMVFLMNAVPVDKVRAVCESGGVMPQKSTYFYPKVLSGLVINDLREA